MKNVFFKVFRILIGLVLIGKILNWFLNFSDAMNQILNIAMFCLIGIAYLVIGYLWDSKFVKIINITCGLFLLAMNFLTKNLALNILGILCILTPLLIARFYKEKGHDTSIPPPQFVSSQTGENAKGTSTEKI